MASVGAPPVVSSPTQEGSLGPSLRVAGWLMTGLSLLFLSTRLYCKYSRHRTLHVDDMFLIASWVRYHRPLVAPRYWLWPFPTCFALAG